MSEDYIKQRKKIRFNSMVASILLFGAAFLAIIYGASFLSVYWVLGNYPIAIASFVGALALSILCLGFWLKIVLKMRSKLKALDTAVPAKAVVV